MATVFNVGMTCQGCAKACTRILSKIDGEPHLPAALLPPTLLRRACFVILGIVAGALSHASMQQCVWRCVVASPPGVAARACVP